MSENKTKKTVGNSKFKKGQSGNPGGRPKMPDWFIKRIKDITPQAVEKLEEIINSEKSKDKDALSAIKIVLEYGIGKPVQQVNFDGEVSNKSMTVIEFKGDLNEWSK